MMLLEPAPSPRAREIDPQPWPGSRSTRVPPRAAPRARPSSARAARRTPCRRRGRGLFRAGGEGQRHARVDFGVKHARYEQVSSASSPRAASSRWKKFQYHSPGAAPPAAAAAPAPAPAIKRPRSIPDGQPAPLEGANRAAALTRIDRERAPAVFVGVHFPIGGERFELDPGGCRGALELEREIAHVGAGGHEDALFQQSVARA